MAEVSKKINIGPQLSLMSLIISSVRKPVSFMSDAENRYVIINKKTEQDLHYSSSLNELVRLWRRQQWERKKHGRKSLMNASGVLQISHRGSVSLKMN